jgi:hypothetical protein
MIPEICLKIGSEFRSIRMRILHAVADDAIDAFAHEFGDGRSFNRRDMLQCFEPLVVDEEILSFHCHLRFTPIIHTLGICASGLPPFFCDIERTQQGRTSNGTRSVPNHGNCFAARGVMDER